jgi:hypothetical protein
MCIVRAKRKTASPHELVTFRARGLRSELRLRAQSFRGDEDGAARDDV